MKRCAVLLVGARRGDQHAIELKELGFAVSQTDRVDDDRRLQKFPVIVLCATQVGELPMIAARLRAKPAFGRKVIDARVPDDTTGNVLRTVQLCGLDDVFYAGAPTRFVAAAILRRLRARPDLQCDAPAIPETPAA